MREIFIRFRLTPDIYIKIKKISEEKNITPSVYMRNQLVSKIGINSDCMETVKSILFQDIFKDGIIINNYARQYNTKGASKNDQIIDCATRVYKSQLKIKKNLTVSIRPFSVSEFQSELKKEKNIQLRLNKKEHTTVIRNMSDYNFKTVTEYARCILSYFFKYTSFDVMRFTHELHMQIYPVISNLQQICHQYEISLSDFTAQRNILLNICDALEQTEKEIMEKAGEMYGDNEDIKYKIPPDKFSVRGS